MDIDFLVPAQYLIQTLLQKKYNAFRCGIIYFSLENENRPCISEMYSFIEVKDVSTRTSNAEQITDRP